MLVKPYFLSNTIKFKIVQMPGILTSLSQVDRIFLEKIKKGVSTQKGPIIMYIIKQLSTENIYLLLKCSAKQCIC